MAPWLTRCQELIDGEDTLSSDLRELDSGIGSCTASFMPDRMAFAAYNDVVARLGKHPQSHLVGHRSGWQPKRGLLSKKRGDPFLEVVYCGVFGELIVANRGGGDRRPHFLSGASDSIRSQVYRVS